MIESYIQGATSQLIERAMALKGEIPKPPKMEFQALANECRRRIDESIKELRAIRDDRDFEDPEDETLRLLEFRRVAAQIDRVENAAIAAMARSTEKESAVASLLCQITKEIIYPIELPTASLLSQNYFYVNTDFQLLCIPLMELHFLLHLPDIYHELAHPLFRAEDDPRTKGWLDAFRQAQRLISAYFTKQLVALESARTTDTIRLAVSDAYKSWQCRWMEEFFCDLFGVFSVGPAFAWAHLHLHAERGRNAFQLPRRFSTHPADAPRMTVMLDALTVLNQGKSAAEVETKWKKLLSIAGQTEPSDFQRYYPKHVLRECVEQAFEGFAAMGCKPWPGNDTDAIRRTLNEAWQRFWTAPQSFAAWEKEVTEALIPSATS
jgi:hypothetical protein